MSRIHIYNENRAYTFNGELDIGTFIKYFVDGRTEDFFQSILDLENPTISVDLIDLRGNIAIPNASENNFLENDDKLIFKKEDSWFISEKDKKPQHLINYIINEGKIDPNILGDKYYQRIFQMYSSSKGVNYTEEDFNKEITSGKIFYEINENNELTNLKRLEEENSNSEIIDADLEMIPENIMVQPEKIIKYIKDDEAYVFPFDSKIINDTNTMNALRKDLQKRDLKELKEMLVSLQAKNDKLRAEIAFFKTTNIQKELSDNANLSKEFKELKSHSYNPNDASAMEQLRQEHKEGSKQEKEKAKNNQNNDNIRSYRK